MTTTTINTQKRVTKRSFAKGVLRDNVTVLTNEGPKAFRKASMNQILAQYPETTPASLGAIYNDAKHLLVNSGELKAFGRHGKGRNHNSGPKVEMVEGAKWQVVNKETGKVVAYATSRVKATQARTDAATQKVEKIPA